MERTYNEQVHGKNVNFYEEWSRVYKWYRRYKESERRRQQDARMSVLIAWEDYSKGTRWL